MKKLTLSIFTMLTVGFSAVSLKAQTTVTEADITRQAENTVPTDNWVGYTRNGGQLAFMQGPGNVPAGCGSLQFTTPTRADKAFLYNYDFNGTPLSAITALSYATYQTSAEKLNQVTAINIVIDYNGPAVTGGQAVLVFEPLYNTDQGTVMANAWQTWDAFKGGNAKWWSARPINGVCASSCFVTWNHIIANNPQAVITGGIGFNQGSGNPGLTCAVDAFSLDVNGANTTFNFENVPCSPVASPSIYQPKPNTTTSTSSLVYPNPTDGEVNVQLPEEKAAKADIVITDAGGTLLQSRKCKLNGQVETFDLSGNSPGLYLIKVITKSEVEQSKTIVQ